MAIQLHLAGAFSSEDALRRTVIARRICFDHDPFYVRDRDGRVVQIGFQLNLYGGFTDPRHLPVGEDKEYAEIVGDLNRICRVFFQSLDVLKPCEYPEPPAHRIVYSPERRFRAEVCLQVPIFDREHFGAPSGPKLVELLATAECLLKQLGARAGRWDQEAPASAGTSGSCEKHAKAASES